MSRDIAVPPLAGPARPKFLDAAKDEKLWDVVLALSTELAATRARLDALERVLTETRCLPADAIESWLPSTEAGAARARDLQNYTRRVFETLRQQD